MTQKTTIERLEIAIRSLVADEWMCSARDAQYRNGREAKYLSDCRRIRRRLERLLKDLKASRSVYWKPRDELDLASGDGFIGFNGAIKESA